MIVGSYKVIDVRIYVYMYTYAISIVNTPRHIFSACFLLARPPLLTHTYTYTSTYVYICTYNTSIANSPRLVKSLVHFSPVLSPPPLSLRTHTLTYAYSYISTSDTGIVNSCHNSRRVTPREQCHLSRCTNIHMYVYVYCIVHSSRLVTPLLHLYRTKCSLSPPPYINIYMYTCIYLHVA